MTPRWIAAALWLLVSCSASSAAMVRERGLGARPPTPAEQAYIDAVYTEVRFIAPNDLARERAAAEIEAARARGETPTAKAGQPASVDNSTLQYFPPIRSQGAQGSCTCWAGCYYYDTFTQAVDEGYDVSGGNNDLICSPGFMYPLVNDGFDWGANTQYVVARINDIGCSSWSLKPYLDSDWTSWPSEAAWVDALRNRTQQAHVVDGSTQSGLDAIKQQLANGNLAVTDFDVYSTWYDYYPDNSRTGIDNDVYYCHDGELLGGHAVTLVGYDDNRSYVDHRDAQTHHGAFLVANSWGDWWGVPNSTGIGGDGFFWVAYDMFLESTFGPHVYYNDDRPDYRPLLYGVVGINHPERWDIRLRGGVGSPADWLSHDVIDYAGGDLPLTDEKRIAVDLTDGIPYLPGGGSGTVFVEIFVWEWSYYDGTITSADFFADLDGDGTYNLYWSQDPTVTVAPGDWGSAAADLVHQFRVIALPPSPDTVSSGATTSLSATYADSEGHGATSWLWDDGGAGGTFSPSATTQNPTYTAPEVGSVDLVVTLTVSATCDGSTPLADSDSTTLMVSGEWIVVDESEIIAVTADAEKYQVEPAVDGDRIIWSDGWDACYGIRLHALDTAETRWVAEGEPTQKLGDIARDIVLWLDEWAGHWSFHTMGRDLATETEFQVSENTRLNDNPEYLWPPAVDGDLIAFTEPAGTDGHDLFLYDLGVDSDGDGVPNWRDADRPTPDPARQCLVSGNEVQKWPAISGRRVVWEDLRNGNSDIYLYDLDLEQEFALCTQAHTQAAPGISGSYVVWTDYRSGQGDIYLYNLSVDSDGDGIPNWRESPPPSPDPALSNLTPDPNRQRNCAISGRWVVWEDDRWNGHAGTDICAFDLFDGQRMAVTRDTWDQSAPDVSYGLIVWQDNRYGNADILAWDGRLPAGAVEGTVTDEWSGLPVSGATVECGFLGTSTGWDGVYRLPEVPTGTHTVSASAPAYYPASQADVVVVADATTVVDFMLSPRWGSIAGTVTDASTLAPIEGATVSCEDQSAVTGGDGTYVLMNIRVGDAHAVTATAPNYETSVATGVAVADGATTAVDFSLNQAGSIAGTVRDAVSLGPVAAALVSCGGASTSTAGDGSYLLPGVPAGSGHTVTASAPTYRSSSVAGVSVAFGETTTVDFLLRHATGTITGKVLDSETRLPIPDATVECDGRTTTADASGKFRFNSVRADMTYTVTASAPHHSTGSATGVAVKECKTTAVEIALSPTATGAIAGTVTDAALGGPIAGATVTCGALSATTGADGGYLLSSVGAGIVYRVGASAAGYYWRSVTGLEVSPAGTTTVNFALWPLETDGGPVFEEVSFETGCPGAMGAAWGDYDGDGYADLFITGNSGMTNGLLVLQNNGDLTFDDVGGALGVPSAPDLNDGVAWADFDNDGDLDAFVGGDGGVSDKLYRNDREYFTNVAWAAGLTWEQPARNVSWGDYDGDNWLDLFVCYTGYPDSGAVSQLFRNNGDGTFANATEAAGLTGAQTPSVTNCAAWGDYDNDGWPDLVLSRMFQAPLLYRNNGDGTFTELGEAARITGVSDSRGVAWGDYDNDGWLDCYIVAAGDVRDLLFHNNGDGTFTNLAGTAGMAGDAFAGNPVAWADYDNDGYLDMCVGGDANDIVVLYRNNGDGTFSDAAAEAGLVAPHHSGSMVWADIDLDGRLDLFHGAQPESVLSRNTSAGNWLRVRALTDRDGDACDPNRVDDRDAIGARVELNVDNDDGFLPWRTLVRVIDGGSGYLGQSEPVAQFGVPNNGPVAVRVFFPDGSVVTHRDVAVNQQTILRDVPDDRVQEQFEDVPLDFWAYQQIENCVGAGIVSGYQDGRYHGDWAVTRDQMAVFISRGLADGDSGVPEFVGEPTFPDVPSDHWALKYVEYAVENSVVGGYADGRYRPSEPVDRGQMAVFIARAIVTPRGEAGLAGYEPPATASFADVPTDFWAYRHVEYIAAQGIVSGYGDGYHPEYTCSRDQMAVYMTKAFGLGS